MNPPQLHQPPGYHHVTVVPAGPTAHLAGQCPIDAHGRLIGPGDIDAQVDQVVSNATAALAAVSAVPDDVIRSVIYVVSDETDSLERVWTRLLGSALAPAFTSAATVLGVSRLGFRGNSLRSI
jgi:enamine deaminase RidA (YjgF/YER057c/UK114 family)